MIRFYLKTWSGQVDGIEFRIPLPTTFWENTRVRSGHGCDSVPRSWWLPVCTLSGRGAGCAHGQSRW